MEPVLRAIGCYLLLLFVVRLSGKRGLAQVTIFDLVLLLLISQTVGQALIGNDSSLTTAAIITITLVVINRANDTLAHRWADMSHVLEDAPLVLIENGVVHEDRITRMKARDFGAQRGDRDHREGTRRRARGVSRRLRLLPPAARTARRVAHVPPTT
jgi:uncharacterized membrane protein YcaP (DUF421 family)